MASAAAAAVASPQPASGNGATLSPAAAAPAASPSPSPAAAFGPSPVKCLLKWDAPKNDLTAAKAALVKRLTRLGATPAGAWKVAFGAYERHRRLAEVTQGSGVATSDAAQKRAIATERDAHMRVLRLNDDARPFFLAAGQQLPIQADAALEAVLISSVSVCELRFEGTIEGHQYAVGDFTVSVGSLKLRGSYRAVIVEVEYKPCSMLTVGDKLLQQFLFAVGAPDKQHLFTVDWSKLQLGDQYTSAHTALQYFHVFAQLA